MSSVAQPRFTGNPMPDLSADAVEHLRASLAERSALARSLAEDISENDCALFARLDVLVQGEIDALTSQLARDVALAA